MEDDLEELATEDVDGLPARAGGATGIEHTRAVVEHDADADMDTELTSPGGDDRTGNRRALVEIDRLGVACRGQRSLVVGQDCPVAGQQRHAEQFVAYGAHQPPAVVHARAPAAIGIGGAQIAFDHGSDVLEAWGKRNGVALAWPGVIDHVHVGRGDLRRRALEGGRDQRHLERWLCRGR